MYLVFIPVADRTTLRKTTSRLLQIFAL